MFRGKSYLKTHSGERVEDRIGNFYAPRESDSAEGGGTLAVLRLPSSR